MTLPIRDSIFTAGKADPGIRLFLVSNVEHHVALAASFNLNPRNLVLLPRALRFRAEDRVACVFLPSQSVRAGGVADGIRLILFAAGIPHAEEHSPFIPDYRGTHHGKVLLPRLIEGQDWLIAHALPRHAIRTCRVADPRVAVTCSGLHLAGVPHVIGIAFLQHTGPVDVVFPTRLLTWTEHNLRRLAPVDAILALDQRHSLLRPPGKPHAVGVVHSQHGNVKTGAVSSAHHRIPLKLFPAR